MFTRKEPPKYQKLLERELERQVAALEITPVDSPQYAKQLAYIKKLHMLLAKDKPAHISQDTKATIAANLAGILMILHHERVHLISRSALSFVTKLRM